MMDKEKLIQQIMKECEKDGEPVTKEEATEMAEMEIKAKKDCKRYESDVTTRKKPQREKKIDTEKVEIINFIASYLKRWKVTVEKGNVTIINPQQEISFILGDNDYSIKLIKHRKGKEG